MIQLVENMTTIYFRLPDDVGITYDQLKKLLELKDRPYSQVATGQIANIQKEIEELSKQREGLDYGTDESKKLLSEISEKFNGIKMIQKQLRPFGNGVHFDVEVHQEEKLAWFKYYKEETLSQDEIDFIQEYIQQTLDSDEVVIEVEYYKLDNSVLNN